MKLQAVFSILSVPVYMEYVSVWKGNKEGPQQTLDI